MLKKQKQTHAGNLHISNDEDVNEDMLMEPPGANVENNDKARKLSVDEAEAKSGGNTHTSILAKSKEVKAEGPGATQTVDIDVDPSEGYVEDTIVAKDENADEFIGDDVVSELDDDSAADDTSETFVTNNENPDVLIAEGADSDADEWDPLDSDSEVEETEVDAEEEEELDEVEVDIPEDDPDAMALMDVDEMDDTLAETCFANVGTTLHVIKANRIIASINKKIVAKSHADLYTSDQFHKTVAFEVKKQGLRKTLAQFGFRLARVNFTKAALINKRVEAKVKEQRKALDVLATAKEKRLEQSLAIAAVGINRMMFKGVRNDLRAALEEQLLAMGVRDAKRIVSRLFKEHGVAYAKSILEQGKKISALTDHVRNDLAATLDITEDPDDTDDDLMDDIAEEASDADDEGWDETEATTVQASLMRPAFKKSGSNRVSVTASAVLNGDVPLTFNI